MVTVDRFVVMAYSSIFNVMTAIILMGMDVLPTVLLRMDGTALQQDHQCAL